MVLKGFTHEKNEKQNVSSRRCHQLMLLYKYFPSSYLCTDRVLKTEYAEYAGSFGE